MYKLMSSFYCTNLIVKRRQKKSCNKQVFFGNLNYRVGDANEKR